MGNPIRESRQSSRIKKEKIRDDLWRFVDDIFWPHLFSRLFRIRGQTMTDKVRLSVSETKGIPRQNVPITQGVPLPKGALHNLDSVWVENSEGQPVSAQFRTLSRWEDGSLKWVLIDFSADVPAEGRRKLFLLLRSGTCPDFVR